MFHTKYAIIAMVALSAGHGNSHFLKIIINYIIIDSIIYYDVLSKTHTIEGVTLTLF